MTVSTRLMLTAGAALAIVAVLESRRRQRRKRHRVAVRLSSKYAADVLRIALARCRIVEDMHSPCEIGDFSILDWDAVLDNKVPRRVSCLYIRAGLVRKGMLAHHLAKQQRRQAETENANAAGAGTNASSGAAFRVIPQGVVADIEDDDDLQVLRRQLEKLSKSQMDQFWEGSSSSGHHPQWVAKASNANRGENIFVASNIDQVITLLKAPALVDGVTEWVIQRYVAPPLLVSGRKFHLRAHFLVSGCLLCGTTRAWLHRNLHVCLVSTVPYSADGDHYAHLTNHCVQEGHPQYDENEQIFLLEELDARVGREGVAAQIRADMERSLAEALQAASKAPAGFTPLPQCFELFGADFTFEDRGPNAPVGVWLLEVNAGPDLGIFGDRLRSRCVDLMEDVLRIAVEPFLNCGQLCSPKFVDARACICGKESAVRRDGFGDCMWSAPPRTASAVEELASFKRRFSIASRWAKSLHESTGVAVRGAVQEVTQ